MARVTGLGGFFFTSDDPDALSDWYRTHLGVPVGEHGFAFQWRDVDAPDRVGRTVWSAFETGTDYFAPSTVSYVVNFRVDDLDGVLDRCREAGIEVVGDVETYSYGRFGWILDPEGRKVELWEPAGEGAFAEG